MAWQFESVNKKWKIKFIEMNTSSLKSTESDLFLKGAEKFQMAQNINIGQ